MVIRELTRQACLDLLARIHLGRLACAQGNQPLVVPMFFAYHENSLYCASTVGRKIEWMRENPLVAVAFDEIDSAQAWASVVVQGRYEELADAPKTRDKRHLAWSLLQERKLWWEPGYAKTILAGAERPLEPVFFRIRIEEIVGRAAGQK